MDTQELVGSEKRGSRKQRNAHQWRAYATESSEIPYAVSKVIIIHQLNYLKSRSFKTSSCITNMKSATKHKRNGLPSKLGRLTELKWASIWISFLWLFHLAKYVVFQHFYLLCNSAIVMEAMLLSCLSFLFQSMALPMVMERSLLTASSAATSHKKACGVIHSPFYLHGICILSDNFSSHYCNWCVKYKDASVHQMFLPFVTPWTYSYVGPNVTNKPVTLTMHAITYFKTTSSED